jgi:hypothetical protein
VPEALAWVFRPEVLLVLPLAALRTLELVQPLEQVLGWAREPAFESPPEWVLGWAREPAFASPAEWVLARASQ